MKSDTLLRHIHEKGRPTSLHYAKLALIITFLMRKWPIPIKVKQKMNISQQKSSYQPFTIAKSTK